MKLSELISLLEPVSVYGFHERQIDSITCDSRKVHTGSLFVSIKGYKTDGQRYIPAALKQGAVCIVAETRENIPHANNVCILQVVNSRKALSILASAFYRFPSDLLNLVGVTGTNGKTTTTHILAGILKKAGHKTGLIGTIGNLIGDKVFTATHTTPDSPELQRYFRQMVDSGVNYAVLEVSSHGLALNRLDGCTLKAAAFTNFSRDHLDFHNSMEDYLTTKKKIFDYVSPDGFVVLNHDDQAVKTLLRGLKLQTITCGLQGGATVRALQIQNTKKGLSFTIQAYASSFTVRSILTGLHNVSNILMAVSLALGLGIEEEAITSGVEEVLNVPGRFEKIDLGRDILGIVDYAHTDDALRRLLSGARSITRSKLITVFGCGGDRDKGKRSLMGQAASELSDIVVVSSDNPRTEEPMAVIQDILKGISKKNYHVIAERGEAIFEAVRMAEPGDTVVIAGKGHENYQEIGENRIHFSDMEMLQKAKKIIKSETTS